MTERKNKKREKNFVRKEKDHCFPPKKRKVLGHLGKKRDDGRPNYKLADLGPNYYNMITWKRRKISKSGRDVKAGERQERRKWRHTHRGLTKQDNQRTCPF